MYCLALPNLFLDLSRFGRLLSAAETERAGRMKRELAKNRLIAGRGVLREILGGYLGVEPENVPIATGMHGKPFLAECAENLRFNLSHAGDVLLLAVAAGFEVGIDVEISETDKSIIEMARVAFSLREQEELSSLSSPALQRDAFYRCWTRKEACLKACGRGFSLASDSFDVSLAAGEISVQTVRCNLECWHVLDIELPHPYCAALAVETCSLTPTPPTPVWITHPLSCT
jgi:4'-phosphopantetheinyl transferase